MKNINPDIIEHVEEKILPLYSLFDDAHDISHVDTVIRKSLSIAKDYDVDLNMVYIIAAYHDVGYIKGSEAHEIHGAEYLLGDTRLDTWFSQAEKLEMAEAVRDHRASIKGRPSSIYGEIVSEADRDLHLETVMRRCIQYSHHKHIDRTKAEHKENVFLHMEDKYGRDGYVKLWLKSEENVKGLEEIRKVLEDRDEFNELFNILYQSVFAD